MVKNFSYIEVQVMKDGNKRIMKNTVMLYIRMLLIMFVTFYTSRIVLQKLGVQDYGIYNVVGGVVSMLAFLNSTLSATCQRYFSYELGRNDKKKLAELFRLNLTVFIYFILLVFLLAETVGLWFINTQLVIPMERLYAMNWVYQFSILTFMVSSLSVPYNALIISHERMSIYAYISILEVLLKLGVVFLLGLIAIDNLILYGLLLFLSTGIITFFYYLYCHFNYPESRYSYYWKSDEIREVASYSTWHFLGSISNVLRGQGVNILLNMFFSPVINAARAIAFQVNMGVYTLMNNFFTAVKPQIYKLYSTQDFDRMNSLINWSSKICFFLVAIVTYPIIANTEYVLSLWLGQVPLCAVYFTQLVLINMLIDSVGGPAIAAALATGKIRNFELITGGLNMMNLPISYILLNLEFAPSSTMIVAIALSYIAVIVRPFLLKHLFPFDINRYFMQIVLRLTIVGVVVAMLVWKVCGSIVCGGLGYICLSTFLIWFILCLSMYYLALNSQERCWLKSYVLKKLIIIHK